MADADSDKLPATAGEPAAASDDTSPTSTAALAPVPALPDLATARPESAPPPLAPAPAPGTKALERPPAAQAQAPAPHTQDIADRTALILIDIGEPDDARDVKPFLRRLYADHRAFDSPLGAFGRQLFTSLLRPTAARDLTRALARVGGHSPLRDELSGLASRLCDRLNARGDLPLFVPFVAFQFATPSIEQVICELSGQGFTQVVALWARPFPSRLTASARETLLRCADERGAPPAVFIERWLTPDAAAATLGAIARDVLATLTEHERALAHLCFALQALPIDGDRDPTLAEARGLAALALESAGIANDYSVVYLGALEPRAPLAPTYEDLFDLLKPTRPPLVTIPLCHLVDDLTSLGELDGDLTVEAQRRGFSPFRRAPMAGTRDELLAALETATLDQLVRSNEFREETSSARGR